MADACTKVPSIWTTGWTDTLNTGTWRNAIAVHQKRPAPCHGACPVDGEIPVWIQQVRDGEYKAAWQTLMENNPIPATIGRTCHHPCEGKCNRGEYDGAVSINALEQFIGDLAIREGWSSEPPAADSGLSVAIVGGGPAGLSCAYQLRRKGVRVTIYDANPELGGVLRYGIPQFRLPKEVLAAEIKRIVDMGVEVVTNRKVSGNDLLALQKEHGAVFIAFGAHRSKSLPLFPKGDGRIINALEFLHSIHVGTPLPLGKSVVVIGGGSVAMDVAGSAVRLGSEVQIFSLERRGAMPAPEEEVEDVLADGAVLTDGAMVKTVDGGSGRFHLGCVRVELDAQVPAGVIRPIEIQGTGFELEADTIILAVGQDPALADWETVISISNNMVQVDGQQMTSRPGVFAAGDVASTERFVSTAIGDGKRAAGQILRYFEQMTAVADEKVPVAEVAFSDVNTFYFPPAKRQERNKTDAAARSVDFREIRLGLSADQALAQAERCFSCGNCIECDNCFYFCPDMAIAKDPSLPLHYRVLDQYCKGCGCCLEECPRGAMGVLEESK